MSAHTPQDQHAKKKGWRLDGTDRGRGAAAGRHLHACKDARVCVCVCVHEGLRGEGGREGGVLGRGGNSHICDHLPNETGGLR